MQKKRERMPNTEAAEDNADSKPHMTCLLLYLTQQKIHTPSNLKLDRI